MVKKLEKPKEVKIIGENPKIEKVKKKRGRKPLKVPIQSPKHQLQQFLTVDNELEDNKIMIQKPDQYITSLESTEGKLEKYKIINISTIKSPVAEQKDIDSEILNITFDNLNQSVKQLRNTLGDKIDELQAYMNANIQHLQQSNVDFSTFDKIRIMIAEEVSKQFNAQFENFKNTLIEGKLNKKIEIDKRVQPTEDIRPTVLKIYEEKSVEPIIKSKRGRKKKIQNTLTIETKDLTKNLSSVAEIVDEPKKDKATTDIVTFNNLIDHPVTLKTTNKPIETQKNILEKEKHNTKAEKKLDNKRTTGLLPSVPLTSIKALIEGHDLNPPKLKRAFSMDNPVFRKVRPPNFEEADIKSVQTEIRVDKTFKLSGEGDIDLDFNAFSLNS